MGKFVDSLEPGVNTQFNIKKENLTSIKEDNSKILEETKDVKNSIENDDNAINIMPKPQEYEALNNEEDKVKEPKKNINVFKNEEIIGNGENAIKPIKDKNNGKGMFMAEEIIESEDNISHARKKQKSDKNKPEIKNEEEEKSNIMPEDNKEPDRKSVV